MTVACVLVRGRGEYTPEYVYNLRAMVKRYLPRPHRFVCLTDQSAVMPEATALGIELVPVVSLVAETGWWTKLRLFDPALKFTGRMLYLDLDVLVVGALDALVDFPAAFALPPHAGRFEGRGPLKVVKRYNSSAMVFNGGEFADLFTDWDLSVSRRLWGDQDWIGERHPELKTFPAAWVPRLAEVGQPPFPMETKVILSKKPKNHVAAQQWAWFGSLWRGEAA